MAEGGASLDKTRVKAIFYALYFGADDPGSSARQEFADCFTKYETRTRTVTRTDEDGNEVEVEESYTVALLGLVRSPLTLTSKWRCGPVERPVDPDSAITSPARTVCPTVANNFIWSTASLRSRSSTNALSCWTDTSQP